MNRNTINIGRHLEPTVSLDEKILTGPTDSFDRLMPIPFTSQYTKGHKGGEAVDYYLEQIHFSTHGTFPNATKLKVKKAKKHLQLRKMSFAVEYVDSLIIGDDPLVALSAAYSLAKKLNHRVLIVPTHSRLPQGDDLQTHMCRIKGLYRQDTIGDMLRENLMLSPEYDLSDYDNALYSLSHACQTLNSREDKIMLGSGYSLFTERTDGYQIPDEKDEHYFRQLFYAHPKDESSITTFQEDWSMIARDFKTHRLPEEAYDDANGVYITEIITKFVFISSPAPSDIEQEIVCRAFPLASGIQSVDQITYHTNFEHEHRMLDVMSGVGADLLITGEVTPQDFIRNYIHVNQ